LENPDTRNFAWPETGRIAGIDYGTVRIGVAVCDPSRTWTSPLETYTRRNEELDGRESQKSAEARDFALWLHHVSNLPVRLFDERYTTALANRMLRDSDLSHKKRKKQVDKIAAHFILEAYLDSAKLPTFLPLPLED
jgi:putative holliday junction resolvase